MQHSSSRNLLLLSDSKSPIKRESTHLVTLIMGHALKGLKGTTIIAWQSQANSQRLSYGWHNFLDKAYSEASVTIARKRTLSSSRKSSLQNIEYTLDAFKWGICRGLGTGQEYQDCIAFHRLLWPELGFQSCQVFPTFGQFSTFWEITPPSSTCTAVNHISEQQSI